MDDAMLGVRIVRLRRTLAAAQRRYARRHNRSSVIWQRFRSYYGKNPRISSHLTIVEEWDNRPRRWSYEDAYHLEDQAAILTNRLTVLLNSATSQRTTALPRGVLMRVS